MFQCDVFFFPFEGSYAVLFTVRARHANYINMNSSESSRVLRNEIWLKFLVLIEQVQWDTNPSFGGEKGRSDCQGLIVPTQCKWETCCLSGTELPTGLKQIWCYFGDRYWSDCRFAIFGEGWEKGGEEEGRQGSVTRMNSGQFTNEVGQWCLVVESAVFLDVWDMLI